MLTDREREIVERLGRGEFDEDIAKALGLSVHTVRAHVRNAMRSTGARTRPHLVGIVFRPLRHHGSG